MLRVVAHKSAAAARQYYTEGLKREDYYSEGQEVVGRWHGKAAARLGLEGDVRPEAFAALIENRHPATNAKLTPRMKADRRVGYDINFHAPKSLSVLQALMGDDRITKVFREAVVETMAEMEERVGARVRKRGAQATRTTGNLAWAEFVHFTARPVGGIPDPHLHVHCFAFNLTHDAVEDRWKAAEFHDLKKEAPYAEAAFHSRLAVKVAGLGYATVRSKTGWEVAGVPDSVIGKFSRRTEQIEELAKEKGITTDKEKDALGALSREGKRHGLTYTDLLAEWGKRLTPEELAQLSRVRYGEGPKAERQPRITAREAIDYALEKCFAKNSVAIQSRLVGEALKHSVGGLKPDELWRELSRRQLVVQKVGSEILCTTLDILAEEVALIDFVRSGRGMCPSLQPGRIRLQNEKLAPEQQNAVSSLLKSTSQVIAIRGGAGVGKTTLMQEAGRQLEAAGLRVFAFAPSAVASRETLREAGFAEANTVAHLLQNKQLQQRTRGEVIWIDEAGLLGTRELWQVMQIAGGRTRVILTGDSGQHAPVARGDAFRLVQHYAGLPVVEVTQIRRQQREQYKLAVAALARGDLPSAFRRLEELGAVVEVDDDAARYRQLADDYILLSRKNSGPLVVSPTHAEGAKVTAAIRQAKREAGQLGEEREFIKYQDLRWENVEKRQAGNYREGLVVQFHQNAKGIRRGELFEVVGRGQTGEVIIKGAGERKLALPLVHAERFQVYEVQKIQLAKGDQIRITRNGDSANGRRLNNGNGFTVEKFKASGNIVLRGGAELDARHGHFTYGYCQTSHSSQSKSVKDVLIAQSEKSFVASSREQFYVSVSRGKESVRVYTDDLRGLREAVGITSTRLSALELAGLKPKDISAMSNALKGRQWQDAVRSRMAEGEAKHHLNNLLRERKQAERPKDKDISWKAYLEMRRGLVGPDGKSRSKGYPEPPQKRGGGDMANKRRSFLRPTEMTTPTAERMKAAHQRKLEDEKRRAEQAAKGENLQEKKPEPKKPAKKDVQPARVVKAVAAVKSAAANFKQWNKPETSAKAKEKSESQRASLAKKGLKPSSALQAAKRSVKNKKLAAQKQDVAGKRKAKTRTQAPVVPRGPKR